MRRAFGEIGIARRTPRPVVRLASRPDNGMRLPKERPLAAVGGGFAPIELAPDVRKHLEPVRYEGDSPLSGRVNRIKDWDRWNMEEKIAFLRRFVEDTARDPAIAAKAVEIIRGAGVRHRDHRSEWAALLKWVQENIRFTAEPNERIQSPQYTLSAGFGDCDDLGITLAALGHSIRLPFRFVLSGRDAQGNRHRWVEGVGKPPKGVNWTHIFVMAQWPPFRPIAYAWAEPTLDVPLGWDFMKEAIPKGRTDMGADDSAVLAKENKILKGIKQLPWLTIAGTVVGSVLSFVLIHGVVAPRLKGRQR